jgi:hypothetical protein
LFRPHSSNEFFSPLHLGLNFVAMITLADVYAALATAMRPVLLPSDRARDDSLLAACAGRPRAARLV